MLIFLLVHSSHRSNLTLKLRFPVLIYSIHPLIIASVSLTVLIYKNISLTPLVFRICTFVPFSNLLLLCIFAKLFFELQACYLVRWTLFWTVFLTTLKYVLVLLFPDYYLSFIGNCVHYCLICVLQDLQLFTCFFH